MNGGDGAWARAGWDREAPAGRRGARPGSWIAAAAQGAPQAKPDPSHETQSAVADYNAGDFRAALVQFHDAAERGDRLAQFNYAMMLLTGEGVTANVDEGCAG